MSTPTIRETNSGRLRSVPDDETVHRLVTRCVNRRDDECALKELLETLTSVFAHQARSTCILFGIPFGAVEDMVGETVVRFLEEDIRVIRQWHENRKAPFLNYASHVARNLLIKFAVKHRRTTERICILNEELSEGLAEVASTIDGWEFADRVRDCMSSLPSDYKRVIQLRYVDGFSAAETAQFLGISPGAVDALLHRARKAFRSGFAKSLR